MTNQESQIVIKDLVFSRGDRVIYDGISLNIPKGKITTIMGPSGTGKTTLLRLIAGQLKPDSGTIQVNGLNVPDLPRKKLYELRKDMGMLFQSGALFTDMNVFDNVAFPLRRHTPLSETIIRQIVLMKLHAVGLRGAHKLMPNELSGGMQRRVALARTIALAPSILMYDEPFAGQDPIAMGVLVKLIRELNNALGMTSIIVSHDVQEAASISDYIYILSNKKLIASGSPEEVLQSNAEDVSQFMHGKPDGPVPFHFSSDSYYDELTQKQ